MKHNLKALGLVLLAAFAIGAVAASAASANNGGIAQFWADGYPATFDITGEKGSVHQFVAGGKSWKCAQNEAEIAVHASAELPEESTTLQTETTSVEYTNCHAIVLGITFPITIDFNHCNYRFTAGETVTHEPGVKGGTGTVDIVCDNAGEEITITVFNNSEHDPVNNDRCVTHIPPQNDLGTITYTNKIGPNGKKAVTIDMNVAGITATVTDTNKLGCNTHEHIENMTYEGTLWAEGTNELGEATDIEVT